MNKITTTWDKHTDRRIKTLHPLLRQDVVLFINLVEVQFGIFLRVTQAERTIGEQNDFYAIGRTAPGNIVTNARGGQSFHNYGLAFDIVEIKNKKASWKIDWDRIIPKAKKLGFEWGGDFRSFKDKPHFQKTFGLSIAECKYLYKYRSGHYITIPVEVEG